ncbi:MAG: hypothetical protein F4Y60_06990 [Boseongicola sp. SB0664_bin_43]|uniref:Uncharacterized protein n=1 Tax=Boseongicola sp. SB0664_bin_43 TaxID=2604844 RepID=A0A6B0Y159_9RHOB|nr:hypothetical protein [Boseongicola sp. SB0664_bin_43]
MQLDWNLSLSGEDYVTTQAWRDAKLDCCPEHPGGGCRFARHGTYRRKTRWGDAHIPRWYCRDAHKTWSLLARCFAARLPGTLDELEAAALAAETEPSLRAAAERARPGHAVTEPANRRWLKGRRDLVVACLVTVITLLPELFAGCAASVTALRGHLGTTRLLVELRGHAAPHLRNLAPPLGFGVRIDPAPISNPVNQHMMGPDPPA